MRYTEIKKALLEAEILDEVFMSPSSLKKWLAGPEAEGMMIGIEFEMAVPNVDANGEQEPDYEPDYDYNESCGSIGEIIDFFRNGDFSNMSRSDADRYRDDLANEYWDWQSEAMSEYLDNNESQLLDNVRSKLDDEIDRDAVSEEAHDRWVEEHPKGDPTADDSSQEIRELTLQMIEDALDEMILDASSREYERAYDSAREEMEDDFRSNDDGDEETWLNSIGVNDMQDAANQWNFDWPHMIDSNEGNGGDLNVDEVADEFAEAMGLDKVNSSDSYHGARRDGVHWCIEPDGSIDANDGDGGLEFISPPLPLKDGLEQMHKIIAWANDKGCYTNKSTGLHMNISVPDFKLENLDYVKLALFMGDEHILKEFGRSMNTYCKSALSIVKEKVADRSVTDALLKQMREHLNIAASKAVHNGTTNKFTSINTKGGYVEFRGPGGDYLSQDVDKLINTALRLAQSLRIAIDESAYKKEYAKKLYKLISPEGEWTDPNNSVALFSRYALGQINKSELVDNIRQAQVARKEKKDDEQQYWVMNKDGSGGKQMVFATSSTEAIIKGGKQMGMSREASISTLKAEPFVDTTKENTPPASVPISWIDWLADTLPTVTVDTINSVRQRIVNGGDNLDADAKVWIIAAIDDELHKRRAVDNNETRWQVKATTHAYRNWDPVYVDSDSPGQAKAKAVDIFRREHGITIGINELDAIATTASAGRPEVTWNIINGLGEPAGTVNARSSDEALHVYGSVNNVDTRYYRATSAETTPRAGTYTSFADAQAAADRMNASGSDIDNVPQIWHAWINTLPNRSVKTINNFRYQIEQGEQNNTLPNQTQRDALVRIIDAELRSRQDAGETTAMLDSLPEQWKDWLQHISTAGDANLQSNIDDLTNHPDRYREMSAEQRGYILDTINKEQRNRRESSPVPTTSREVFDGLPEVWQDWLQAIGQKAIDHLERAKSNVEYGNNSVVRNLDVHQKNYITATINQELMRRQANDANASTTDADNSVRDSLPFAHRQWITTIFDHSDMGIINVLNNVSVSNELTDQQAAYFRVRIKRELRRRGINPDEATPSTTSSTYADDADERERMRREREQISRDMSGQGELDFEQDRDAPPPEQDAGSDIDFEQDRDAAAQQGQLIDNDGPVVPQTTSTDFEVVKQDGSIVSTIRGGDMVYAHRKARELEQDLGLESGSLRVKALAATNESLTRLRKLAGLM